MSVTSQGRRARPSTVATALSLFGATMLLLEGAFQVLQGILVTSLSALASFAIIPLYPDWALAIIALDVVVVWALSSLIRADNPA